MPAKAYDCAQERLDGIYHGPLCAWCKYPFKPIYRAGLCRHCYNIKTELRISYRQYRAAKAKSKTHHDVFLPEYNLQVTIKMAESAQTEGRTYGALHKGGTSNLDLEHDFGLLSRIFLRKDMYKHDAFLFDCFTVSQKDYLRYIISRMIREHFRRTRRARVAYLTETLEETMKNRFWGTYRVEEDVAVVSPPSARKKR